jgi:hypothetical protein
LPAPDGRAIVLDLIGFEPAALWTKKTG